MDRIVGDNLFYLSHSSKYSKHRVLLDTLPSLDSIEL